MKDQSLLEFHLLTEIFNFLHKLKVNFKEVLWNTTLYNLFMHLPLEQKLFICAWHF